MTRVGQARIRARVEGGSPPPPIRLWVEPLGGAPRLRAHLARDRVEAYAGDTTFLGARIVLGEEDVTAWLDGALEITDGVGERTRASFTLAGERWLPHRDLRTWTRTPIEIVLLTGADKSSLHEETLEGTVITGSPVPGGMRVEAGDLSYLYGDAEVCETLDPLSGLTRDAIARQVAEAAGVPAVDIPPGAVYPGPIETAGARLLSWLESFGEPEGWHWRFCADGTLEAYTVELKSPEQPPDGVWRLRDLDSPPAIQPPADVPSTWVVRGTRTTVVDEQGLETEVQVATLEAVYALAVAVEQQFPDGTRHPVGGAGSLPEQRLVSRITTTTVRRGDRPVRQSVLEEGYRNPARARLTTAGPGGLGNGPAEGGYYYVSAFIDDQGRFVQWPQERFGPVGERVVDFHYDEAGSTAGETRRVYRWHRLREAVRLAASVDEDGEPVLSHLGAAVGEDGVSSVDHGAGRIEIYGLAEEQRLEVLYGPEGSTVEGAQVGDRLRTWGYLSPRAAVNPESPYWVNADGTGMLDVRATWREIEDRQRRQLLDADGRIQSEITTELGHTPQPSVLGEWDMGDYQSVSQVEPWRVRRVSQVAYVVLGTEQYQRIALENGQAGLPETLPGRPPVPLWRRSPWTTLVQQPVELIFDDDLLREWFGPKTRVIPSDWIQSVEEARTVLRQHLLRDLSYELTVTRPETHNRPGDTVLVIDPQQRFTRRALVWSRTRTRSLWPPDCTSTYRLLAPLPIAEKA